MAETSATVSVQEAADLAGKSRQTIYRHIDKGKVSAEKDRDGNTVLNVAELERAYGPLKSPGETGDKSQSVTKSQDENPELSQDSRVLQQKVEMLEQLLEDRDQRIDELKEDKQKLERWLEQQAEDHRTAMRMLTWQGSPAGEQDRKAGENRPWWWPFGRGRTAAES